MNGAAEAIYATGAIVLGTVMFVIMVATARQDLSTAYVIPGVWAGVWSFALFLMAGKAAQR